MTEAQAAAWASVVRQYAAGMFNLGPEKLIVVALIALVVLGPERLPEAARKAGKVIRDLRMLSERVQSEVQQAIEEHTGTSAAETVDTLRSITGGPLGPVRSGINAAVAAVSGRPPEPVPTEDATAVAQRAPKKAAPAKRKAVVKKAPARPAAASKPVVKKAAPRKRPVAVKKAPAPAKRSPVAAKKAPARSAAAAKASRPRSTT